MRPRSKYGIIGGLVGVVLSLCMTSIFGYCGPIVAILVGSAAGFLAAQEEKAISKGNGARLGAVAGCIAGSITLFGQLLGGLGAGALIQLTGIPTIFGDAPSPSDDLTQQVLYYLSGLGTALCLGIIGIIAASASGAAAGYLGTPDQKTSEVSS